MKLKLLGAAPAFTLALAALLLLPLTSAPQTLNYPLDRGELRAHNKFFVFNNASGLSNDDATVTVQQPASNSRWVHFEVAQVYCSVDCAVSILRDGTAATTTAATEVNLNGGSNTAFATAFTASNVGAGTTILTIQVPAGATIPIDLSRFFLEPNNSTANNLSIDTNAITGNATIYIRWREE